MNGPSAFWLFCAVVAICVTAYNIVELLHLTVKP